MNQTVACPAGCAGALPVVKFDKCAPDARVSEITNLLIGAGNAAPFTDWTQAAEWATRLDQAAAGDKIRTFTVRGNKPATEKTEQVLTANRRAVTNRRHIINFVVDEMTDENYDFFRTTQCGIILFRVWYVNNNGKDIYGGNPGIHAALFGEPVFDEGTGVLQRFVGSLQWDSMQDPPRAVNPIAGL